MWLKRTLVNKQSHDPSKLRRCHNSIDRSQWHAQKWCSTKCEK